jgi:small conductance mechanosensitive channel
MKETKILQRRIKSVILAGVAMTFIVWLQPVRSQEMEPEATTTETSQPVQSAEADPAKAFTAKDPTIPVDELKLLLKPLTLEELQNEATAWMLLVKEKGKEISNAEIAIKRQNLSIENQKKASDNLDKAKQALDEAQKAQSIAKTGTPEYEDATKKIEAAKAELTQAQESLKKVEDAKKETKQDEGLTSTLKKAAETGKLDEAQKVFEQAKQDRDKLMAGTPEYDAATQKLDTLEAAIKNFETAQQAQREVDPNSAEFQTVNQQVEEAKETLKQAVNDIQGEGGQPPTATESSGTVKDANEALKNTNIDNNSQSSGTTNLEQKGQQLEKTAEKLEENAQNETDLKNQLVINVTNLQGAQTELIDRLNVVLQALEARGGDIKPFQSYIQAITKTDIDVKDTQSFYPRIVAWLKSEQGGLRWVGNLVKFIAIMIGFAIASQILATTVDKTLKMSQVSKLLRDFAVVSIKRGGFFIGLLVALTALGVSLGPLLAVLGGLSFVLGFALQSNLGNFASGLMLMFNKPFDVGDEVKIGELWAFVDSITVANTKLKGFGGQIYTLPNNEVWGSTIQNFTTTENRKISISIRVDFSKNVAEAEKLLLETIKSVHGVLEDPAPTTFVWSFEEYYITVLVFAWTTKDDYWDAYSETIRRFQKALNESGIGVAAIPAHKVILNTLEDGSDKMPKFITENSEENKETSV